jgi:O-antigen/teichoic acid export membrane protein
MGVISDQSLRHSIVQYTGIGIGLLSTLFVYPLALSEMGLLRFVMNTAQLATPFCLMGVQIVAVRFFPTFKDPASGHHGFLSLLQLIALGGVAIFGLLYLIFHQPFTNLFSDQPAAYLPYLPYAVPLTLFMVFSFLFTSYATNFHKVLYPSIFNEMLVKLGLPALVLLYFYGWIGLGGMMTGMLGVFFTVALAHISYLAVLGEYRLRRPNWDFITPSLRKELAQFGFVNILTSWAFMISSRIDIFMLGLLLGPGAFRGVGIYSILYIISEVIDAPRKAVNNISSPIVAQAWKENNLRHLKDLYEKSSLNQFLAGWLLFIGIWGSLEGLFLIMPNGEEFVAFRWVVFLLGLSKVIDMLTGVNTLIIQHSRYFHFNFYSVGLLAAINIFNNLLLIPEYGMVGASMATLISVFLYNLAKFIFLWVKMGMQPFGWKTLIVFGVGLLALGLGYLVPISAENTAFSVGSIVLRSGVIASVYLGIVLWLRISPELNELLLRFVKR